MSYTKKEYSSFIGQPLFSEKAREIHLALYEGYVSNVNALLEKIRINQSDNPQWAEMKRRFGWEFDGMRLHELYFDNLGKSEITSGGSLEQMIQKNFGSYDIWKNDFLATAKMRGIGWAILYQDADRQLFNFWIGEHDEGHPAGLNPLLVVDVFEHAYFLDFGKDRAGYLGKVMENIDWREVESRLK